MAHRPPHSPPAPVATDRRSCAARWLRPRTLLPMVLGLGAMAACFEPEEAPTRSDNTCTACHGAERQGSALTQAAPPRDLGGHTEVGFPGVGAHEIHLSPSSAHAALACAECHLVPERVGSPGHADSALPAEFTPGDLARQGGRTPTYDPTTNTCSNTYCHQLAEPHWTEPRTSAEACGSCHGLPPPPPHPSDTQCARCHGAVIDSNGEFSAPERHVDGHLDLSADCGTCHGSEQSPAPPVDLSGATDPSSPGVGAHQVHLTGGFYSRPVSCDSCHRVPAEVGSPGHLDTTPGAEVRFSGVATRGGRSPSWDPAELRCSRSWCHGPSSAQAAPSPSWTSFSGQRLGCDGCHGLPPPYPHPPAAACEVCHSAVVAEVAGDLTIIAPDLHIDGKVEVFSP